MSAIQSWIEGDDAKRAEALKTKTTSWFVLQVLFGLLFLGKAVHFALTATGIGGYALAALFTAGGAAWLVEGAQGLRSRLFTQEV
jgi:hypothetical protein